VQRLEGHAEVEVRLRHVGPERDGAAVGAFGAAGVVQRGEHAAEEIPRGIELRRSRDDRAQDRFRFGVAPRLEERHRASEVGGSRIHLRKNRYAGLRDSSV
jgi:hypothetical protein